MLSIKHPIQLALGLIIWSVWFVFLYATVSISCANDIPIDKGPLPWINAVLIICSILVAILLGYMAYVGKKALSTKKTYYSRVTRFIIWVGVGVNMVALCSTISIAFMLLFYPPCL